MSDPLIDQVRTLNRAPAPGPSTHTWDQALLEQIVRSEPRRRAARRRRMPGPILAAAALATCGTVAIAVQLDTDHPAHTMLDPMAQTAVEEMATGLASGVAADGPGGRWVARDLAPGHPDGGPIAVRPPDGVGVHALADATTVLGMARSGTGSGPAVVVVGPCPHPPPGQIAPCPSAPHSGVGGDTVGLGRVGDGVTAVRLVGPDGGSVVATVADGLYLATGLTGPARSALVTADGTATVRVPLHRSTARQRP